MNRKIITIVLVVLAIALACVYWLGIGFNQIALRESLYLATSGIAMVGGLCALFSYGFKGPRTRTLLLLTGGMGYLFIGELFFDYYEYILGINPFPSVADIFYMLAYPMLVLGLINEVIVARVNWEKLNKIVLLLFFTCAVLFAVIVGYFGIYQAYDAQRSLLANGIAMSYGVGDLLLIVASLLIFILIKEFQGGILSRVLFKLFFGFLCTLVGDILFAIYTTQYDRQIWFYKSLLDSFWVAGYLLFASAMFDFAFSIQEAYQKIGKLGKKSDN